MKKSLTIIGKMLLKAVMFLAGFLAFFYVVGEPTDEWWAWARKTFGALCGIWCFIEKLLAILLIVILYKVDQWLGPVLPDEAPAKAVEER